MNITHTIENNVYLVASQGQLALENVSSLKEYLTSFLEDQERQGIILDFSEVTFVDSKGVSLIILTNMALQNRSAFFGLINVNEKIMEVFNLSGLSNHIQIFPDKTAAFQAMEKATV